MSYKFLYELGGGRAKSVLRNHSYIGKHWTEINRWHCMWALKISTRDFIIENAECTWSSWMNQSTESNHEPYNNSPLRDHTSYHFDCNACKYLIFIQKGFLEMLSNVLAYIWWGMSLKCHGIPLHNTRGINNYLNSTFGNNWIKCRHMLSSHLSDHLIYHFLIIFCGVRWKSMCTTRL